MKKGRKIEIEREKEWESERGREKERVSECKNVTKRYKEKDRKRVWDEGKEREIRIGVWKKYLTKERERKESEKRVKENNARKKEIEIRKKKREIYQ